MKIALIVLAVLAALVALLAVVGWSLPVKHRAARQVSLAASPDVVYAAISSPYAFPSWRSKVTSVEMLPDTEHRPSYREIGGDGNILYVVDAATPPSHLVTRIADSSLPFGGTWTYDIVPAGAGATLCITEDGEVYNVIFRVMSKYVFGHTATIDTYFRDLGRHLDQDVTITDVT